MTPPVTPWVLSAPTAPALAEYAARLQHFVAQRPELDPSDVACSLCANHASFDHRAVVVGADRTDLLRGLAAVVSGTEAPDVARGHVSDSGETVFVFPGEGTQWRGMAVELLTTAPAFAHEMRLCEQAFREFVDWSLGEVVRDEAGAPSLERVDVAQPVMFAVMVSLAAQWRALGIRPAAVLGHAQGELAAAYVAGALSLRAAAQVVTLRSRALGAIAGLGGMVSINRPIDDIHALIRPWLHAISIGAQDGPRSNTVTGHSAALDELMVVCARDEVPAVRVPVDYAPQSAHVEALRTTLQKVLSGLQPRAGDTAFISGVTGAGLDTTILDGDYWFANLRQPVLFEQSVRWAYDHGYRTFVECSPHPVLNSSVRDSLEACDADYRAIGTLTRSDGSMRRLLMSAAELYVAGKSLDWGSVFDGTSARRIDLPGCPAMSG